MSAASARAALIDLATMWRRASTEHASRRAGDRATVYALCADQLSNATVAHLGVDDATADALGRLQSMADAFTAAMAVEGVPARVAERVVNIVLHGHPDGVEAARITGHTSMSGLKPQYHAPFEPVYPCRAMPTRHCPVVFEAVCGERPCHRYELDETNESAKAVWLAEMGTTERSGQ